MIKCIFNKHIGFWFTHESVNKQKYVIGKLGTKIVIRPSERTTFAL